MLAGFGDSILPKRCILSVPMKTTKVFRKCVFSGSLTTKCDSLLNYRSTSLLLNCLIRFYGKITI